MSIVPGQDQAIPAQLPRDGPGGARGQVLHTGERGFAGAAGPNGHRIKIMGRPEPIQGARPGTAGRQVTGIAAPPRHDRWVHGTICASGGTVRVPRAAVRK